MWLAVAEMPSTCCLRTLHARRNGRCGAGGEDGRGAARREGHSNVQLFARTIFGPLSTGGFLPKPFSTTELVAIVQEAVGTPAVWPS